MYKFKIKSKSKNYDVFFSNDLTPLLKQNFHKNDFIIASTKKKTTTSTSTKKKTTTLSSGSNTSKKTTQVAKKYEFGDVLESSNQHIIFYSKGCIVIDNTSHFRMNDDVPLIVPEVNADILEDYFDDENRSNIIANPNCSTIQMVVALKPIHDAAIINRIVVSTYQSVSGAGKETMDELWEQTKNIYANQNIEKKKFTKQIAFNVIPHIGSFLENGDTKEEEKMINETKKILDPNIRVSATCVRVPVFISHAESINLELDSPMSDEQARELLNKFENISVVDHRKDEGYVTPVEVAGEDKVYVSRIRQDDTVDNGLNLWVVSDNLRKGAALNAVQIAEEIIQKYSENL